MTTTQLTKKQRHRGLAQAKFAKHLINQAIASPFATQSQKDVYIERVRRVREMLDANPRLAKQQVPGHSITLSEYDRQGGHYPANGIITHAMENYRAVNSMLRVSAATPLKNQNVTPPVKI